MRIPTLAILAGVMLVLPVGACGQARQAPAGRPNAGLTLKEFIARREQRMLAADTDGDGKVSRAEYLAGKTTGKGDPARRFGRLDRNADGVIDRQEIADMLARRFKRLDADGDGSLTAGERAGNKAAPTAADGTS